MSSSSISVFCRMSVWSGSVPAAEAKKAEDASVDTLLTPRPPEPTGRLACVHWLSDSETLHILETAERSRASNSRSFGWSWQGAVRSTCWNFGPPFAKVAKTASVADSCWAANDTGVSWPI